MAVLHSAPKWSSNEGVLDRWSPRWARMWWPQGRARRDRDHRGARHVEDRCPAARCAAYQQLMEIAGVDYPERAERFEVVYMLLSLTKNHRLLVKVTASEDTPVPTATACGRWPAGWSAKCSTCMAWSSRATPTCAAS
jgi:NADH-quinone oxidoreductase subunit C